MEKLSKDLKIDSFYVLHDWISQFETKEYPDKIKMTKKQFNDYKKLLPLTLIEIYSELGYPKYKGKNYLLYRGIPVICP